MLELHRSNAETAHRLATDKDREAEEHNMFRRNDCASFAKAMAFVLSVCPSWARDFYSQEDESARNEGTVGVRSSSVVCDTLHILRSGVPANVVDGVEGIG